MNGGASAMHIWVREPTACLTASPLVLAAQPPAAPAVLTLDEDNAAGGANATRSTDPRDITNLLLLVHETHQLPPLPLVAHPRVLAGERNRIQQTLLNAPANSPLKVHLKNTLMAGPIAASYRRDYQPLGKLGLER